MWAHPHWKISIRAEVRIRTWMRATKPMLNAIVNRPARTGGTGNFARHIHRSKVRRALARRGCGAWARFASVAGLLAQLAFGAAMPAQQLATPAASAPL